MRSRRAAARAIEEAERENAGAHASAARISVYPNSPKCSRCPRAGLVRIRHEAEEVLLVISDLFLTRIEKGSVPLASKFPLRPTNAGA